MLDDLERNRPGTKTIMMTALSNVRPSQLLDRDLWKTLGLAVTSGDAPDPVRDALGVTQGLLPVHALVRELG